MDARLLRAAAVAKYEDDQSEMLLFPELWKFASEWPMDSGSGITNPL